MKGTRFSESFPKHHHVVGPELLCSNDLILKLWPEQSSLIPLPPLARIRAEQSYFFWENSKKSRGAHFFCFKVIFAINLRLSMQRFGYFFFVSILGGRKVEIVWLFFTVLTHKQGKTTLYPEGTLEISKMDTFTKSRITRWIFGVTRPDFDSYENRSGTIDFWIKKIISFFLGPAWWIYNTWGIWEQISCKSFDFQGCVMVRDLGKLEKMFFDPHFCLFSNVWEH